MNKIGYVCRHSWDDELENPEVYQVVVYPTREKCIKDHQTPQCGIVKVELVLLGNGRLLGE